MRSLCLLLAVLTSTAAPAWADDVPPIEDRHVEEALVAAGENRPQLEAVLAHYAAPDQKQRLHAARFLIANMPGKGYIVTELRDPAGKGLAYDPLAFPDLKAAHAALDALEAKHGEIDFARDKKVEDVKTITSAFLIRHIDLAFEAWERTPTAMRVGFDAFLNYVLPYRGSQEPLDDWRQPLMQRYAARARDLGKKMTSQELYKWLSKDVSRRVRFDERFYLHPTDQSFTEMGRTGQGRCEDITNMTTYAARSMALATAADYTPAWAHRDNNHAWNVLLDAEGRGSAKSNAHAAKVYRKTFALQRDGLAFRLAKDREAPNRFLKSTSYIDVTDQYAPTTDVTVALGTAAGDERFAYLCVFNGGKWVAIHWGAIRKGRVTFDKMGRDIAYVPAVFDGEKLVPAADPLIVHQDGSIEQLPGQSAGTGLLAVSVSPKKVSPDTKVVTPVSYLKAGTSYLLQRWTNGAWETVQKIQAGADPLSFEKLPADGLYWLVAEESRRLERIFTIAEGRQRFW